MMGDLEEDNRKAIEMHDEKDDKDADEEQERQAKEF